MNRRKGRDGIGFELLFMLACGLLWAILSLGACDFFKPIG
jgi:hypothetical protein